MSDKLEAYLEEISHFLSGRAEREEILSEIRSHILEKAAEGSARPAWSVVCVSSRLIGSRGGLYPTGRPFLSGRLPN